MLGLIGRLSAPVLYLALRDPGGRIADESLAHLGLRTPVGQFPTFLLFRFLFCFNQRRRGGGPFPVDWFHSPALPDLAAIGFFIFFLPFPSSAHRNVHRLWITLVSLRVAFLVPCSSGSLRLTSHFFFSTGRLPLRRDQPWMGAIPLSYDRATCDWLRNDLIPYFQYEPGLGVPSTPMISVYARRLSNFDDFTFPVFFFRLLGYNFNSFLSIFPLFFRTFLLFSPPFFFFFFFFFLFHSLVLFRFRVFFLVP